MIITLRKNEILNDYFKADGKRLANIFKTYKKKAILIFYSRKY